MSSFVLDFFSLHNSFFKTSTPFSLPPPPPRRFLLHPKMAFAQSMRASVQARPTSSRSRAGVRAVALVRRENAQAKKKKKTLSRFLRSPLATRKKSTNKSLPDLPTARPALAVAVSVFHRLLAIDLVQKRSPRPKSEPMPHNSPTLSHVTRNHIYPSGALERCCRFVAVAGSQLLGQGLPLRRRRRRAGHHQRSPEGGFQ